MAENFVEKWFCGRIIAERDSCGASSKSLVAQVADLQRLVLQYEAERITLLESASQDKQQLMKTVDDLNQKITALNAQIADLQVQLNQKTTWNPANSATFSNLPMNTRTLLLTYLTKYPEAFITYGGRFVGSTKERYNLDVKAWLMEGQNDWEIVSAVRNAKARVSDVLAEQSALTFHQACDVAFMRVTHALGDSIAYTYDSRSWGENEFWQFASETRFMGTGDCEDKAIMNYVGARIAGIPWEMLRITAGLTFDGQGHATNFYYASDLKWHHRNSTTNYPADKSATSLPLTGDSSEALNIKNPWFSATETKTFNWFGTEAEKADAMKLAVAEFFKFLTITPLR
jgi:predicted transglutaminase-like cysteine proteinase/uncharacterized small protein (DUF1192 family)